MRKLATQYGDNKQWDLYKEYDQKQKIIKVQLNSIYGVLGLDGWRFYDKYNASAVTFTGQRIIKTTDQVANKYFTNKLGKLYEVTLEDGSKRDMYGYELELNGIDIADYEN